jgi:Fe-S oxidoreductase
MGNEYVFQMLATGNVETLNRYKPKTIITACPHCFNTIGNEYGQLGGSYKIVHHSTFLADLVSSGRLATVPEEAGSETGDHRPGSVTVHDSCYLARYNNVVAAPRDVLGAAGVSITEMDKSGRNTFCCGAGGARMWREEHEGSRINHNRANEVALTLAHAADPTVPFPSATDHKNPGQVGNYSGQAEGTVAVACPFCHTMIRDGLADTHRENVKVRDVAEIVAESLQSKA